MRDIEAIKTDIVFFETHIDAPEDFEWDEDPNEWAKIRETQLVELDIELRAAQSDGISIERHEAICNAEREGRCMVRETCEWSQDDGETPWDCSCGLAWEFTDGGNPYENNTFYCPKCGKEITRISWFEPDEENNGDDGCTVVEVLKILTRAEAEAVLAKEREKNSAVEAE